MQTADEYSDRLICGLRSVHAVVTLTTRAYANQKPQACLSWCAACSLHAHKSSHTFDISVLGLIMLAGDKVLEGYLLVLQYVTVTVTSCRSIACSKLSAYRQVWSQGLRCVC